MAPASVQIRPQCRHSFSQCCRVAWSTDSSVYLEHDFTKVNKFCACMIGYGTFLSASWEITLSLHPLSTIGHGSVIQIVQKLQNQLISSPSLILSRWTQLSVRTRRWNLTVSSQLASSKRHCVSTACSLAAPSPPQLSLIPVLFASCRMNRQPGLSDQNKHPHSSGGVIEITQLRITCWPLIYLMLDY